MGLEQIRAGLKPALVESTDNVESPANVKSPVLVELSVNFERGFEWATEWVAGWAGLKPAPTINRLIGLNHTTANLIAFNRFKQRLEIAFAKTVIAFALNKFEEYRAEHGF